MEKIVFFSIKFIHVTISIRRRIRFKKSNKMSSDAKTTMCHLSEIESTITLIFKYDPHLQFVDSFEKLNQQFTEITDLLTANCQNEKDYWIIYDAVVVLLPYLDRLIFEGY